MTIHYRPMVAADIPILAQLALNIGTNSNEPEWSVSAFESALGRGYVALVGLCNESNALVGYAVASYVLDHADIQNIVVSNEKRGQGLGKGLLVELMASLKAVNVETVFLEVRQSNLVAIALYESIGFECIQKRRSYYPGVDGVREDALVFSLSA